MSTNLSLGGQWKLRGDFMDVDATQWSDVLRRMDSDPVMMELPYFVTEETMSKELKDYVNQTESSKKFHVRGEEEPNIFPSPTGHIMANVPCDVTTALVENGIIEEPLLKTNTKKSIWIKNLCWWFTRDFEVSQELLDEDIILLNIEVLDFNADIIINGVPFAKHTNSFVAFSQDVKNYLHIGTNSIVIRLTSGMELNFHKDSVSYYAASKFAMCDQRVHTRKAQYTYGWDWCQAVPTCGIGRYIGLEGFSGAKVVASRVDTLSINNDSAELEFNFEIEKSIMAQSADVTVDFSLEFEGETVAVCSEEIHMVGGINFLSKKITIDNPKLWWPNGYGEANLYEFKVSCTCKGRTNTAKSKKIGIRTIEIDLSKIEGNGRNFFFKVNGVRIFCKGGNWVPTDSIYLRTPCQNYKTLVSEAAACNFNMLRMWGGGVYEPDCFYEYCSEYGIMLMHDFMYACAFYPDHIKDFLYEAELEADYQTKRLAHFPCMAVWTGNNEIAESYDDWFKGPTQPKRFYGDKIFNYIQPRAVHKNSPKIHYMPSSPYYGDRANENLEGDIHAWTYFGRDVDSGFKFNYELEAFDRLPARFSSEYGFFGAQMESTVRKYHQGEEMKFDGEIWVHHGEFQRKRKSIDITIQRHLTEFDRLNVSQYLKYSGAMQGLLYSEMAESILQKSYGSGDLIWMYNDCWAETGWTVIDYYLTRKISFYFLKRAFATQKLIVRKKDDGAIVTVINQSPKAFSTDINCGFMSFTGEKSCQSVKTMEVAPHSWAQFEFKASGDEKQGFFFVDSKELGTADSMRAYYREYDFPTSDAKIVKTEKDGNDLLVTVVSSVYTPIAYLMTSDDTMHYYDNFFKLYPNQEKTVRLYNSHEIPEIFVLETMKNLQTQVEGIDEFESAVL